MGRLELCRTKDISNQLNTAELFPQYFNLEINKMDADANLFLIGACAVFDNGQGRDDAIERFYGSTIARLAGEVYKDCETARLVGYRTSLSSGKFMQFFGVEAAGCENVPAGMLGWSLDCKSLCITGGDEPMTLPIEWLWRKGQQGEFIAFENQMPRKWMMSTDCFICTTQAAADNDLIELTDYDESWPDAFESQKRRLLSLFGDVISRIEHYGSTAIPQMPAKPIIDILVEVPSYDIARERLIPALCCRSCEYWWYSDHIVFIERDRPFGKRCRHIHIAPKGHRLWEGIAFRDYLIAHPEAAKQYAALKKELAACFRGSREKYTNAKTDFVRKITDAAIAGRD